jgi:hypothetical protein
MVYMALPDGIIMLEIKNISIFKKTYVFFYNPKKEGK